VNINRLKLSATMCYVIPIKDKYLLIDTGYEKDKELFYSQISSLNIKIEDISYVFLTHHHDDHSGLLNEIKLHNNSCKIIMHKRCVEFLKKGRNYMPTGCGFINRRVNLMMKIFKKLNKDWDFTFPPYEIDSKDIIINEEITLKELNIDIPGRIIFTPGHTEDSISLLLDNGMCFVGDAASNMMNNIMGTKYCVIFITNLEEYYKSWEKLIKENIRTIYPAHGEYFALNKLKQNIYKNKSNNIIKIGYE
jgi:glyoxylase-like metal-dependent hydrolase (beta-lactamase superfamily II)